LGRLETDVEKIGFVVILDPKLGWQKLIR